MKQESGPCETCVNYVYDEEYEYYSCLVNLEIWMKMRCIGFCPEAPAFVLIINKMMNMQW